MKKRGHDHKGRPITKSVIEKKLLANWSTLEALYGVEVEKNSFQLFCDACVVKASKTTLLPRKELVEAYQRWAVREKLPTISDPKLSLFTPWEKVRSGRGTTFFAGIKLVSLS